MYTAFFGLSEIPFSIAPDPAYLFLSDRHREALAHLTFGLTETGGFVLLTGEVGTGKTTVSRCLLEQLPEGTRTAFILNPALDAWELLASVCDELHIPYDKTSTSIKALFDGIRDHLLETQHEDKATVLLIDEAQHLKPEVLEHLRLLTNLETNKRKFLKVILIGQPELQELLRQRDLRQLAQRITARYHLLPLNQDEVAQYVQHRLKIAGCQRPVFTRKALKQLHKLSGGVPRLINLLCDRAMLAAYSQQRWQIDHKLLTGAAREVQGRVDDTCQSSNWLWHSLTTLSLTACMATAAWAFWPQAKPVTAPLEQSQSKAVQSIAASAGWQRLIADSRDLVSGFHELAAIWGAPDAANCGEAARFGLGCLWQTTSLAEISQLDQPVLLTLQDERGRSFYATLTGINNQTINIHLTGQQVALNKVWFDQHWRGNALRLWQLPPGANETIASNSTGEAVQWLEIQLAFLQGEQPRRINRFDSRLSERLRWFQLSRNLKPDGIAGAQTLLQLNRETGSGMPQLTRGESDVVYS